VISVAMLGGGAAAADYYLEKEADCELADYYTGELEPAGRWCGHGAAALGLDGPVMGEAAKVFAGLLEGRLPDGTVVANLATVTLLRNAKGQPEHDRGKYLFILRSMGGNWRYEFSMWNSDLPAAEQLGN